MEGIPVPKITDPSRKLHTNSGGLNLARIALRQSDSKNARTRMDRHDGFAAAVGRFPHFADTIERLMATDENFRDMCDELAEAQMALLMIEETNAASREIRRAEWQSLIDRLAKEVEAAIHADPLLKSKPTITTRQYR
jgi:hypothetical protein